MPVQQDDQLKMLMDYTKFHIGMYTTLCTLLVGILSLYKDANILESMRGFLFVTLLFFVAAGVFGGLIASNLPHFEKFQDFEKKSLGPLGQEWIPSSICITLEHVAFWIGILVAVAGLFCALFGG